MTVSTAACSAVKWPTGTEGWSAHAEALPAITAEAILEHLLKTGKCLSSKDEVVVAQKPLRRGYDFFCFWWLCPRYSRDQT